MQITVRQGAHRGKKLSVVKGSHGAERRFVWPTLLEGWPFFQSLKTLICQGFVPDGAAWPGEDQG